MRTESDALINRVADDGLTTAQTTEAMKAIDATHRLAKAEAIGGAKAKATDKRLNAEVVTPSIRPLSWIPVLKTPIERERDGDRNTDNDSD